MSKGLDLTHWFADIQRIIYAEFGGGPMDPDDLVQEVCRKIYKANLGSSPYDPDRSSPVRYICLVARSVLASHTAKKSSSQLCWSPSRIAEEDDK